MNILLMKHSVLSYPFLDQEGDMNAQCLLQFPKIKINTLYSVAHNLYYHNISIKPSWGVGGGGGGLFFDVVLEYEVQNNY